MRVWLDEMLCSGCGLCTEICPQVFGRSENELAVVLELGIPRPGINPSKVQDGLRDGVVEASTECPGEIIMIEFDTVLDVVLTFALSRIPSKYRVAEIHNGWMATAEYYGEAALPLKKVIKLLSPSAYATLCAFGEAISHFRGGYGLIDEENNWLELSEFYNYRVGLGVDRELPLNNISAAAQQTANIIDRLNYVLELVELGVLESDEAGKVSFSELGQYMYETRDDYYRRFEEVA